MWIKDGVESEHQNTSITSWVDIYPEYGKHWESEWTEGETEITQAWKLVEDTVYPEPEPLPEERITKLEEQSQFLTECLLEMSEAVYE